MKSKKQKAGRRRATLRDRELVTEATTTTTTILDDLHSLDPRRPPPSFSKTFSANLLQDSTHKLLQQLHISLDYPSPRSFPLAIKQQCWNKAHEVKGRDPQRWRRDAFGNIVFRKLVACFGCLCHDYDHILPYSKGGKSTLENCQVLQTIVNRSKGNRTDLSRLDLIRKSSYCRIKDRDMDLLERSAYGNVHRAPDSGGCRIQ